MDSIGEAVENVGLAQEIKKGLDKSLCKAPKFSEMSAEIDAKKAELATKSAAEWASMKSGDMTITLGDKIIDEMGGDAATVVADPKAIEVFAKYLACGEDIKKKPVKPSLFEEVRPLGKGAFGAVYLTFKKDTGAPFAVKKMVKCIAKANKMIKDVLIEREVLSKIRSSFCVNLHYAYQTDIEIFLVLTLCPGGDLAFLLSKQKGEDSKGKKGEFKPLPDGSVKYYGASMACGLEAIHEAGYVYRDLKPQNVLLDIEGKVKISDMGLTADVSKGTIKQCSGTRGYWSPETIKKEPYKFEPDWWSLGVTMFVLFSDRMPFHGKGDEEKDASTCAGEMDFKHGEPEDLQQVIKDLCTIDITKRLGCNGGLAELKKHPYFAGFDWEALEKGKMAPPVVPNPNDINAPSKKEISAFKKPDGIDWTDEDQAAFKDWDYMDLEMWYNTEAIVRIKKYKDLGGGGGCCTIA